ncbi:hypothetical protein R6Q57_005283 [Mikania cordata]
MSNFYQLLISFLIILSNVLPSHQNRFATTPPLPVLPLPSYSQLKWQQREIIFFHHFGVNTFTNSEWGTGKESPKIFNPKGLNTTQWVDVAVQTGVSLAILTAKHHDGFCLWPSKYTDHSVIGSPLQNGHGDVVKEFVDAASARGVDIGLYLSPWDRHDYRYGKTIAYNEYYIGQLQELLNNYLNTGDPKGTDWVPAECDVSIRPGWFWHKSESPKKLSDLLQIYYNSVGRNCVLLLNVPPNTTGLISANDIHRLKEFKSAIDTIFSNNLAESCTVKASSIRGGKGSGFGPESVLDDDHLWTYWAPKDGEKRDNWIEFMGSNEGLRFNVVRIQEAIGLGQRIKKHEIYVDGKRVAKGTTVGYKKLHRLENGVVSGRRVRVRVVSSFGVPLISSVGLHFDPFCHPDGDENKL